MRRLIASAIVALCVGGPTLEGTARAQVETGGVIQGARLDLHGNLSLPELYGVGARVDIPVVPRGVLRGVEDEIALSAGVELMFAHAYKDEEHSGWGIWPVLAVQWNFYFRGRWSAFPELGLSAFASYRPYHSWIVPFGAVGVRYHLSRRSALLFRIGFPTGLQVGLNF